MHHPTQTYLTHKPRLSSFSASPQTFKEGAKTPVASDEKYLMDILTEESRHRLDDLDGVWRLRYRLGLWASFEGAVYGDLWNPATMVVERPKAWDAWNGYPPADWDRFRAIDFDQQSYEGRMNFYRPQFFLDNQPLALFCVQHLNVDSARQYQREEQVLMLQRAAIIEDRLAMLLDAEPMDTTYCEMKPQAEARMPGIADIH